VTAAYTAKLREILHRDKGESTVWTGGREVGDPGSIRQTPRNLISPGPF